MSVFGECGCESDRNKPRSPDDATTGSVKPEHTIRRVKVSLIDEIEFVCDTDQQLNEPFQCETKSPKQI